MKHKEKSFGIHRYKAIEYILITIALMVCAGLLIIVSNDSSLPGVHLNIADSYNFEDGWYYMDQDSPKQVTGFPASADAVDGELILYNQLPRLTGDEAVMFQNNYQFIQVYVNSKCIYSFGYNNSPRFGRMVGNFLCLIPLKAEYSQQTISIHLKPNYQGNLAGLKSMTLGPSGSLILGVLSQNKGIILCLIIMVIFGTALLICSMWLHRIFDMDCRIFLNLGLFILMSAVWIWSDSPLPQFWFSNSVAVCLVSFMNFMLMPLPLISFIELVCSRERSALSLLKIACLVNFAVQSLLYVMQVADFPQMLPATHFLLAVTILVILYYLFYMVKKKKSYYAKGILVAIGTMCLFSIIAIILFYQNSQTNNSKYFRIGFLFMIVIFLYLSIKEVLSYHQIKIKAEVYRNLAYTDIMTQTRNRTAFEKFTDTLNHSAEKQSSLTFVMLDINNLKTTNDSFGHQAGDILIISAAECIKKAFSDIGTIYRIGGDEFLIIIENPGIDIDDRLRLLNSKINEYNENQPNLPYRLSIAHGYATMSSLKKYDVDALIKAADENMYRNKSAK